MGGGVGEAEVRFDLGDAAGEALAVEITDEELAEEGSGDYFGGAGVEGSWEELGGVMDFGGCAHILCRESLYFPTNIFGEEEDLYEWLPIGARTGRSRYCFEINHPARRGRALAGIGLS